MDQPSHEVTRLLHDWGTGDAGAAERLMPLVYDELRRLARNYLQREHSDHTLQPTALVDESYLRLVDQSHVSWQNRQHFFGIAAQIMRRVLVDHAREHTAEKRGGVRLKLSLDEADIPTGERAAELVALDEALTRLTKIFPRKGRVVELRFFGGLSVDETAGALGISDKTVMREWQSAKLWLYRELDKEGAAPAVEGA